MPAQVDQDRSHARSRETGSERGHRLLPVRLAVEDERGVDGALVLLAERVDDPGVDHHVTTRDSEVTVDVLGHGGVGRRAPWGDEGLSTHPRREGSHPQREEESPDQEPQQPTPSRGHGA